MKTISDLWTRYQQDIEGVLPCFDRVLVSGTLTDIAYPEAMNAVLRKENIRCLDLGQFADPLRVAIRDNAMALAKEAGIEIQYLSRSQGVRQEELVAQVLAKRGRHPGLVPVLSVMEGCTTFKPWQDQSTGKTGLKTTPGKGLTDSFYRIDPELGFMYVRVPTWLPCRLPIDFNGHNGLASQLRREPIDFEMEDNAFVHIADWQRAQELASGFSVEVLERTFHELAARFCPVVKTFPHGDHWSVMPVEHSLDGVFKRRETLVPLYEEISRQAVLSVRVGDRARFWSKRYSAQAEAQSDFKTLVEGPRIKHALGQQSIKMYDKGRVLRIEATRNDSTFFRHPRKGVGRDGHAEYKLAALKKSLYSLRDVAQLLGAACVRDLDFIGTLEDRTPARQDLDQISTLARDSQDRSWRGFNFFLKEDQVILRALLRGEFQINGLSNQRRRALLPDESSGQIARILRRLRLHRLIKRVGKTYRYYLTELGRRLLVASCKLFACVILPHLQPQTV